MKNKFLLFIAVCFAMTSCKTIQTYYEICNVQSFLPSTHGKYEYKDNACTVSYDFWCNGGNAGFTITNNTNEILYVDLNKTYFVRNGNAYDYFLNRTISSSASIVESASASKSGTAYGYWNAIGGLIPGSLTATIGASSSAAKSTTVATEEKSIIGIPPHTSKHFTEYAISNSLFYDCEHNITPNKKETPTYAFQLLNSPLTFGNYITYRLGDNPGETYIVNDFFVDSITFYHSDTALIKKDVGCPNDKETIEIVRDANPQKFYIRYSRESTSNNKPVKGPKGNTKSYKQDDIYR